MCLYSLGVVPFGGSFFIRLVFSFVIHSGISISCWHLFISIAGLSGMDVNFLNQYPCMPSWPGVLQFYAFLRVPPSKSMCFFAFGPSSIPSNAFLMLLIHSAFLLFSLRSHILLQNGFVSLSSSFCYVHSPPICRLIFFRCFGMFYFVRIVLFCLDIFLVFLL